jgi:hypothetical protein
MVSVDAAAQLVFRAVRDGVVGRSGIAAATQAGTATLGPRHGTDAVTSQQHEVGRKR